MTINLNEIDLSQYQDMLDCFCAAVNVAGAIIDLEGEVYLSSRWQKICTDFHRVHPTTTSRCIESDTILSKQLLDQEEFVIYECKNGLNDAASPIIVDGEHIANAFIGQFLTKEPDLEVFRRTAQECGFDEKSYMDALAKVPILDESRLQSYVAFIASFARMVAQSYLINKSKQEQESRLQQQAEAILELSTPVIQVWDGIVAAPLIGVMDVSRAQQFMERFLDAIVTSASPLALLDITGVPEVDTSSAQHILDAVEAARMLGAEVILTGVRPALAQTLIQLGIDLKGIHTKNSFAAGLKLALEIQQNDRLEGEA